MRLAIIGAGAIGPACAALAIARGHEVAIWSRSAADGLRDGLTAEGAIAGRFAPAVAREPGAVFDGADAALIAVPAYALPMLLPPLAAVLPASLPVLIAPAASLAPLVLDKLMAARGLRERAPIGALATTPVTARRLAPDHVRIGTIRSALEIGAVPARAAAGLGGLAEALFGNAYATAADALQAAMINANPIAHAALALTNVTRIEREEDWRQYAMMTPACCRLMEALQAERDALAASFGFVLPSIALCFHRANGVPLGPLAEMTRAIDATRGAVLGPKTLETRYVTEDVPFGLAFYLRVAAARGVPMPLTESVVRALEALWRRGLRDNPLLEALDLARLPALLAEGHPCSP